MVLGSQVPRISSSNRNMARKRRMARWPWVLGVIFVVLLGYYLFFSGDDKAPSDAPIQSPPPAASTTTAASSTPTDYRPRTNFSASTQRPAATPSDRTTQKPANTTPEPPSLTITVPPKKETTPAPATTSPAPTPVVQKPQPVAPPKPLTDTAPVTQPTQPVATSNSTSTHENTQALQRGMDLLRAGKVVQGRRELSLLLPREGNGLSSADAGIIRSALQQTNQRLVFSSEIVTGDPLAMGYLVQSGDLLGAVAPKYGIPYQLIERINNVQATRIRAGQTLKIIKGPFHAVVNKSAFRLDTYLRDDKGDLIYIRSFNVGLGESGSTPLGTFVVKSKQPNPSWTNPRTSKYYGPDDPENPIGDYWIGLQGIDENTKDLAGYGIHGTIDPTSIGKEMSMGCVRLADADIALVYALLVTRDSTVVIRP